MITSFAMVVHVMPKCSVQSLTSLLLVLKMPAVPFGWVITTV